MAYVVLLEHLERQVLADRQVAAVLMAAGAKEVTLPSLREERERFDGALAEEVKVMSVGDRDRQELRRVLGVA